MTTPPSDVLMLDDLFAQIQVDLQASQDLYFQENGKYYSMKDIGDYFDFPPGKARCSEYINDEETKGYVINFNVFSLYKTTVVQPGISFKTYNWIKEVDFINSQQSFDWTPIYQKP